MPSLASSRWSRDQTVQTNVINQSNFVFANLNQFALLAAVVFVLPQFTEMPPRRCPRSSLRSIFMFSPIGTVLFAFPEYAKANLARKISTTWKSAWRPRCCS